MMNFVVVSSVGIKRFDCILVCNLGYSGLSPGVYTGILVSDKVYKDQCQLHCSLVYQSVTRI